MSCFFIAQVIEKESAIAEAQREIVCQDEAVANEQAGESQALKDECEADLAEAIPALEAALSALNTLKVRKLEDIAYSMHSFSILNFLITPI